MNRLYVPHLRLYFQSVTVVSFITLCLFFGNARNVCAGWPGECNVALVHGDLSEDRGGFIIIVDATGKPIPTGKHIVGIPGVFGSISTHYWEDGKWIWHLSRANWYISNYNDVPGIDLTIYNPGQSLRTLFPNGCSELPLAKPEKNAGPPCDQQNQCCDT